MTDKRYAHEQALRLRCYDKWLDSPDNKGILDELVLVLMQARSEGACWQVVDDWIVNETKMPLPADLRRLVSSENEKRQNDDERQRCSICGGCGFVTKWFLITYRRKSLQSVMRRELLPDVRSHEQAMAFAEKVAGNPNADNLQTVLSGAAPCSCLPATHAARVAA